MRHRHREALQGLTNAAIAPVDRRSDTDLGQRATKAVGGRIDSQRSYVSHDEGKLPVWWLKFGKGSIIKTVKLAVCIVHNRDKNRVTDELVKAGFKFTVIGSTGGFLREGNTTILIGSEEEDLPTLKRVLGDNCQSREQLVNVTPFEAVTPGAFIPNPVKVPVGGAVMFVIDVESFHRF